jgi:hypothetical protein
MNYSPIVVMAHQTYREAGAYWCAVFLVALEVPLWAIQKIIENFALEKQ